MSVNTSQHGRVTVVTLDDPAKRNALNSDVARAIANAVREASSGETAQDRVARAILIRANGPAFCAGADLSGGVYADDFWDSLSGMLRAITESPVPVIADVQGPAVGAGCQLILACDLRIFGDKGATWIPVAQHGFAMDNWTIARATELMGGAFARNVLLGSARLNSTQAENCGFALQKANITTESDEPMDIAQAIAATAPLSLEHSKKVLNSPDPNADPALQDMFRAVWASDDAKEARTARVEKRAPDFRGR